MKETLGGNFSNYQTLLEWIEKYARICKPVQPKGDIGVKTIGGGRFAMFIYTGEYKKVGVAYDKIYGELLAKGGFHARGNYCFEKCVSDPRRTAPEKLKTEIYIPIESL